MSNQKFKVKFGLEVGDAATTIDATTGDIVTTGDITIGGNTIKSSGGNPALQLNGGDVTAEGNLYVNGILTVTSNTIKSSTLTALTLSGADVDVKGDLTVTGNDIKSSTATALTLSAADVAVAGNLTVTGNNIKSSTATALQLSGADVTADGNLTVTSNLVLKGATSGTVTMHSPTVAGTQDYTLPTAVPAVTGYVLSSTTGGVMSWVANPDTNTTYTYASTAATGGANLTLTGSDASTNTVKLSNGTGVTVTNISGTEASVAIGQAVATTDSPTFANVIATKGMYAKGAMDATYTDGIVTDYVTGMGRISVGAADGLTIYNGGVANTALVAITTAGALSAINNITGLSTKGTNTVLVGETADASGNYTGIISSASGAIPVIAGFSNAAGGRQSYVSVYEYGQNRLGGTASTGGRPLISLASSRGTGAAPTAVGNGDVIGAYQASGYDGSKWVFKDRNSSTGTFAYNSAAAWTNDSTGSGTGSISGTTLTVTAGTGFFGGALLTGTGIAVGTSIIAPISTATSGGIGTYTVSQTQTVASTAITCNRQSEAGTAFSVQAHPLNMGLNEYTTGSSSRQFIQYTSWNASVGSAANGWAPGSLNYNLGDATPVATDVIYVGTGTSAGKLFYGHGRSDVTFVNANLQLSGVVTQDTATFTASITANTMTVTAVASGVISVGQTLTTVSGTMPDLVRITALGTGTGGTGTYTVSSPVASAGVTIVSTTIVSYPDNSTLNGTGSVKIVAGRKSGISGRKAAIKSGDNMGGLVVWGTNAANSTFTTNQNRAGIASWTATEDYTSIAGGSRFTLSTITNGATTDTTRLSLASDTTVINTDAINFRNGASGTQFAKFDTNGLTLSGTTGTITMKPAASSSNQTYALPDNYPSTSVQFLTSTTGGAMSWATLSAAATYGSFQDTTTQTNPVANAENLMKFGTNDLVGHGVSIVSNGTTLTRITIANAGIYNIQFSAQIAKTGAGNDNSYIWLKKNGTTVADTAGITRVSGNGDRIMASWNYLVTAAASDYYELAWSATDTDVILQASSPGGVVPSVSSVILTVVPVGA